MERAKKVVVVMPAYNAEKTLERTLDDIPREWVDEIILVDDASRDGTVALARKLGLRVFVHAENRGYGGNQKTCYTEAMKLGARHHDHGPPRPPVRPHRHPPARGPAPRGGVRRRVRLPDARRPPARGRHAQVEVPGQHLPDGLRERDVLHVPHRVPFRAPRLLAALSRDGQLHGEFRRFRLRLRRSSPRASSTGCGSARSPSRRAISRRPRQIGFWRSSVYGLSILKTLVKFKLHKKGIARFRIFA